MKNIIILISLMFSTVACAHDIDKTYIGKYTWGLEVESFTPCNSDISYWVSYNWAGSDMHKFYKENNKEPYQSLYIEFRGHLLNEKVDGFAVDYDGLIHISEVKQYSFELPKSCK